MQLSLWKQIVLVCSSHEILYIHLFHRILYMYLVVCCNPITDLLYILYNAQFTKNLFDVLFYTAHHM
jgi:hypothetical protein